MTGKAVLRTGFERPSTDGEITRGVDPPFVGVGRLKMGVPRFCCVRTLLASTEGLGVACFLGWADGLTMEDRGVRCVRLSLGAAAAWGCERAIWLKIDEGDRSERISLVGVAGRGVAKFSGRVICLTTDGVALGVGVDRGAGRAIWLNTDDAGRCSLRALMVGAAARGAAICRTKLGRSTLGERLTSRRAALWERLPEPRLTCGPRDP